MTIIDANNKDQNLTTTPTSVAYNYPKLHKDRDSVKQKPSGCQAPLEMSGRAFRWLFPGDISAEGRDRLRGEEGKTLSGLELRARG
jgi:hypothetical protein